MFNEMRYLFKFVSSQMKENKNIDTTHYIQ